MPAGRREHMERKHFILPRGSLSETDNNTYIMFCNALLMPERGFNFVVMYCVIHTTVGRFWVVILNPASSCPGCQSGTEADFKDVMSWMVIAF